MRGSPQRQARSIVAILKQIGESKHRAKAKARAAAQPGSKINHRLGIYSFSTARNYQATYARFLSWARETHGITDACRITSEHAREWLQLNIERNLAYDTIQSYAAALEKLPSALQSALQSMGIERDPNWSRVIQQCRRLGRQAAPMVRTSRAFKQPFAVVEQLTGQHRVAAELQLHCGCRVGEITELKPGRNFREPNTLRLTNTKGGLVRIVAVPEETYKELLQYLDQNGVFRIDRKSYAADLKQAASQLGEQWSGTHALRWNYARNRMFELEMGGQKTFKTARHVVSHELGHKRPEITQWYLRG
ncbi:MAG: site-specific integrase [Desulfobulbaceae bacterium]|nr:site-specific integrase [Desulfobulbaceae bacterium]